MPRTHSPHASHAPASQAQEETRRTLFKLIVGGFMSVFVVGWLLILRHTVLQGPPPRMTTAQDAARAEVLASLNQMQETLQNLPSLESLITQINAQNAQGNIPTTTLNELASKIAGQATTTTSTTPQTTTTTHPSLP